MRVLVPHTPERLEAEVIEEIQAQGIEPELIEMKGEFDYWHLVNEAWRGGPFILVEHDVIPLDLRAIWECPGLWCGYAYLHGLKDVQGKLVYRPCFGVTAFKRIRDIMPDVWGTEPMDWSGLDSHLENHARGIGVHQHAHDGYARHLNPNLAWLLEES